MVRPLDPLEGQGLLLLQLPPAAFPPAEGFAVPVLGLSLPPLRTLYPIVDLFLGSPDLQVRPPENLGEGEFHMLGNPLELCGPVLPDLLDERGEGVLAEPPVLFRQGRDAGQVLRRSGGGQVAQDLGFPKFGACPSVISTVNSLSWMVFCSPSTTLAR